MTQFNINGQYLDLPANFDLQLVKKNILFAFDDIECERSTSFDIPSTPQNNRILNIAKDYHYDGQGMRMRYEAQMQAGAISKNGYLYVTEYECEKQVYKAVFVTGELFGLLKLCELGTLREILQDVSLPADWDNVAINLGDDVEYPSAEIKDFANIFHIDDSGEGRVVPSFSVDAINRLLQSKGIDTLVPSSRENRVFISDIKSAQNKMGVISAKRSSFPYTLYYSQLYTTPIYLEGMDDNMQSVFDYGDAMPISYLINNQQFGYGYVRPIVAKSDIIITFPEDFPEDWYIVTDWECGNSTGIKNIQFLGDYSFTKDINGNVTRSGIPLAGREINVQRGMRLVLLTEDDLIVKYYATTTIIIQGFYFLDTMPERLYNILVSANVAQHTPVFAIDNIPDIEYIDWQKTIAALEGKVLSYNEQDGLVAEDMDLSAFPIEPINNIISVNMVRRTFAECAQHNVVAFEDGEAPNAIDYTVPNDNIEQENELYTIPLNRGRLGSYGSPLHASIAFEVDDKYGIEQYVMAEQAYGELIPFVLTKNATIQRLCNVSTQIELSARMTLLEYEQIKPKMLYYYDGAKWVWTDAQWSNGVVKMTLQKV